MQWSPVPDLTAPGKPARAALAATLLLAVIQIAVGYRNLPRFLGDTDDALRLQMVRDLLTGQAWFDAHVTRLQPPAGLDMHWSRLVDGGLAALYSLFALVLAPATAELAMRMVWPLLWIFPLTLGAALAARRLGGSPAVLASVVFVGSFAVLGQFSVGRIDHHNVQMALAMLMLAGTVDLETRWGPWLAGLSTGLMLAVGLEALLFAAAAGAAIALRFAANPTLAPSVRRYAAGLAISTLATFFVQTPPHLWGLPVCDMMAVNLLAGLCVASAGLFAASFVRGSIRMRLGAVLAAGLVAFTVYLVLDPVCVRGPFAAMDPRLRVYWWNHVVEVQTWPSLVMSQPLLALAVAVPTVMAVSVVGAIFARDRSHRYDPAWAAAAGMVLISVISGFLMVRMLGYGAAFGATVSAGGFARFLPRRIGACFVPTALAAITLSPAAVTFVLTLGASPFAETPNAAEDEAAAACRESSSYRALAALPPGLFLNDIDFGPDLIAHTPHSALAAPYHRMSEGISTAHEIWDAPPSDAVARLRARGVGYVMLCPGGGGLPITFAENGLRSLLEKGGTVDGMTPVDAGEIFRVWRIH